MAVIDIKTKAKLIKLAFTLLLIVFVAAGCTSRQIQPTAEIQSTPTSTPILSESDCEFSAYEKIEIEELDQESCKRISQYFISDKNHVYKQVFDAGSSDYSQYLIVKEADPATFKPVKDFGYYKDKSNLFFDAGANYRIITGTDLGSIEVLSTHYIKDKSRIYFLTPEKSSQLQIFSGFDVSTFQIFQNEQNHEQYFKDINGVYFTEDVKLNPVSSKIGQADINSFEVLNYYLMAKDKNKIYFSGKVVGGADPKTFTVLGADYFKDNANVYTTIGGFRRLPGIDGGSFELISFNNQWTGYSKDKNKVYYSDVVVEDADPATFQVRNSKAFDKTMNSKESLK